MPIRYKNGSPVKDSSTCYHERWRTRKIVSVYLSESESELLDSMRGETSRTEFFRALLMAEARMEGLVE